MSALPDLRDMLARAEMAATSGDLASADELLRAAARIQEAELGPLHPDLANTLNNLAIIAEKTGQLDDAETFYRRAVSIASASLPEDHPMLAASRQNLEDFCRTRGLPIAETTIVVPTRQKEPIQSARAPLVAPVPVVPAPTRVAQPRPSLSIGTVSIGVVVLAVAALLIMRPWPARETPAPAPTPTPESSSAPKAAEPVPTQPAAPVPLPQEPPATARQDAPAAAEKPTASGRSADSVTLAAVEVCRSFSTSGDNWKCEPAGSSVAAGPLVFYTRVKSPRDAVVVHRWYQGSALQQSVRLNIRANATEGYRTFSRQTVHRGDWRVEVRSASGDLLHEQRVTVR